MEKGPSEESIDLNNNADIAIEPSLSQKQNEETASWKDLSKEEKTDIMQESEEEAIEVEFEKAVPLMRTHEIYCLYCRFQVSSVKLGRKKSEKKVKHYGSKLMHLRCFSWCCYGKYSDSSSLKGSEISRVEAVKLEIEWAMVMMHKHNMHCANCNSQLTKVRLCKKKHTTESPSLSCIYHVATTALPPPAPMAPPRPLDGWGYFQSSELDASGGLRTEFKRAVKHVELPPPKQVPAQLPPPNGSSTPNLE